MGFEPGRAEQCSALLRGERTISERGHQARAARSAVKRLANPGVLLKVDYTRIDNIHNQENESTCRKRTEYSHYQPGYS